MTIDLEGEWNAARARAAMDPWPDFIAQLGVPSAVLLDNLVAIAHGRICGGFFEYGIGEGQYLLVPLRVAGGDFEHPQPARVVRGGELIDYAAVSLFAPHRIAWRVGVSASLGCIAPQLLAPDPVLVTTSPIRWLTNHARGICIIGFADEMAIRQSLLRCTGGLIFETRPEAERVAEILRRPLPTPPILVRKGPIHARAA